MTDIKGATQDEWFHFDFTLGLGANLLPCVPAHESVRVLAGSALQGKVGKIPSQFNASGEAHGLKDWQKRPILSNEIQLWMNDPRLNLCVRTGPISGVYAFDIDIEDTVRAPEVRGILGGLFSDTGQQYAVRMRLNSPKFLIPFRLEGGSCKKRRIRLDNNPRGPAIELLADGQQFVAAGLHSSGARYEWQPSLPETLPTLTLAQVNQIWETLTRTFATTDSMKANLTVLGLDGGQTSSPSGALLDTASEDTTSLVDGPSSTKPSEQVAMSEISEDDWSALIQSLRFLLDKVQDNDAWSGIGYALLSLQRTRPAEQLWLEFSRKAVGYEPGAPEAWWAAHKNQTPRSDWRHIISLARKAGLPNVADPAAFAPVTEGDSAASGSGSDGPDAPDPINVVPDEPARPIIQLSDPRFSEIIRQLEAILVPHAYVQGPHLTRVSEAHTDEEIQRANDAVMLVKVTKAWAMTHLGEQVEWKKYLKSDAMWVSTKPSIEHISTLLDLGSWTRLRPLDAIARAPFVRDDGSICDEPGYDRGSRVLYVPSATFPAIPANPGHAEAHEALERIRGVFNQFPWKEPASESAFLSHILSEAARLAVDRCPMFFYDAPASGTGKSLLQEMAARIVHGTDPALRPWVGDADEVRKSLYASVLAGDRSLWFDNLPDGHKTRSPELCAFLTSSTWKDRKLGESETVGVANKMVVVASGNNITPTGDLARRSLVIRMDANTARLKERIFRIPQLRTYVMKHRPELLVYALTIIKAFHGAGVIEGMPVPMQSFERWSHFCRDPLIWLGLPDPLITQEHETDDESGSVGAVFEKLATHFGDNPFTGVDVARVVNGITDQNGELAGVLIDNGCAEPNNPTKLGYWLRGCRDRIGGDFKLVKMSRGGMGQKWKLVRTHEDLT